MKFRKMSFSLYCIFRIINTLGIYYHILIKIPEPDDPVNLAGASERKEWAVGHSVETLEISVCVCVCMCVCVCVCLKVFFWLFFFKRKHKPRVIIEYRNYFVDGNLIVECACWWCKWENRWTLLVPKFCLMTHKQKPQHLIKQFIQNPVLCQKDGQMLLIKLLLSFSN